MRIIVLLCFVLTAWSAAAQTCTGGLGPPIVNITFGQGFGNGPPLAAGITNLKYVTGSCPNDGEYTIVSYTNPCFSGTWLNIGEDHTLNQAGYFMLINASFQPSDFYVQTVNGLCPGTNYQFSAWVLNMVSVGGEILPNITFRIETPQGQVLATYGSGDIPQATPARWNQYAFSFNNPPGVTSVVLRIRNNAPGGNGNDLALDDISFRAEGPVVSLASAGYATDTATICDYNETPMSIDAAVENCYPSQQVQWQVSVDTGSTWKDIPGENTTSYQRPVTAPGLYLYRLAIAQAGNLGSLGCEVVSNPFAVNILPTPAPAVSITSVYPANCIGLPLHFTATPFDGGNGPHYQWLVDGLPAGQDSSGLSFPSLPGDVMVSCELTSNAVCVQNPMVSSNVLDLKAIPIPVQRVGIDPPVMAVCQDSLVKFVAVPDNGGASPAYQWLVNGGGAGSGPVFTTTTLKDGDVVDCIMTGSLTCSQPVDAAPGVKMTVYPLPVIVLDSAVIIGGGSGIRLEPVITGTIASYAWSPAAGLDDPSVAEPFASPVGNTAYRLYVVTMDGCHSTASELVEVYYPLKMPGAFSPNEDGKNDVFRVPVQSPVEIRYFAVYNRQGLRVFYTSDVGTGWDGRYNGMVQPAGVYVWELGFDNPLTRKAEKRTGTVVLVR
ncbi:gliding motility-associated C-terminal domain-containing protein [Puia sp.]|uniref:T9SS type B sorting domain-containing protein n=1 Tax=Puia sp. TaxID=2045100 RepID=UPI002F3F81BB